MNSAIERLLHLRVADVMSGEVVSVETNQTLDEAADVLVRHTISGAPVADEYGKFVGILTASDYVRHHANRHGEDQQAKVDQSDHAGPEVVSAGDTSHRYPCDRVGNNMSTALQTVAKDEPLMKACREMCALHVHRLPVVDEHGHVEGVVTSLDVVAALVTAIEE